MCLYSMAWKGWSTQSFSWSFSSSCMTLSYSYTMVLACQAIESPSCSSATMTRQSSC